MYYWKEHHSKELQVLQVLLHTAIDSLRTTEDDDVQSSAQSLSECQSSTRDLCLVRFEFFGKRIVRPCDIFEKATVLSLSQLAALGFLAQVESNAACAIARQHDLLGIHLKSI